MLENKCSECGSPLPEGATRCASCGAPVGDDLRRCPECDKMIPAKSVFCPHCGKMVWNDMDENQPVPTSESAEVLYPETEKNMRPATPPVSSQIDDTGRGEELQKSAKKLSTRNRVISISLVVVILGLVIYSIYDWGGGGKNADNPYLAITGADTTKVAEPASMNIEDASSIYGETMVHDNRIGDRSVFGPAAYTVVRGVPMIVGINYFSEKRQRPFFKLTQVSKVDGKWHCGTDVVRYEEDGASLIVDRDQLKLSGENIPRFVNIDGKTYFYFIYIVKHAERSFGSSKKCHLKLSLYNIESSDIVQLDYECEPVLVHDERMYYGNVNGHRETPEFAFMEDELEKLHIVYHPTPEEQEMALPKNASRKWRTDNRQSLEQLNKGERDVSFTLSYYDAPLFSRSDVIMASRVSTETYVYYVTHAGEVFGYDTIRKRFFMVYVDSRGAAPQIEINSDGSLHVMSVDYDFDFYPADGRVVLN